MVLKRSGSKYRVAFSLCDVRFSKDFTNKRDALVFVSKFERYYEQKMMPLSECIEAYLSVISANKKLKSQDIDRYVLSRMGAHFGEVFISEITAVEIESFRLTLSKSMTSSSVNRYFNSLKHFFSTCEKWAFINKNPCRHVKKLEEKSSPKGILTEAQIGEVKSILSRDIHRLNLFLFLLHTGCRLSSAIDLKVSMLDLDKQAVNLITRKGPYRRERLYQVPLCKELVKILQKLVVNKSPSDYVFLNKNGEPFTPSAFSKYFSRVLIKLNLKDKNCSLHSLRHKFASDLRDKGVPIDEIKKLLGHSSVKVTEGYLHSDIESLRKYIA